MKKGFSIFSLLFYLLCRQLIAAPVDEEIESPVDYQFYDDAIGMQYDLAYRDGIVLTRDNGWIEDASPEGYLYVRKRLGLGSFILIVRPDGDGKPAIVYSKNGIRRINVDLYEDEIGWVLQDAAKKHGLGAVEQMRRIADEEGIREALLILNGLRDDSIRVRVMRKFAQVGNLDELDLTELIRKTHIITSSEMRSSLIGDLSAYHQSSERITVALLDATTGIMSTGDKARCIITIARRGELSRESTLSLSRAAQSIMSSTDKANVLIYSLDYISRDEESVSAYIGAIESISSSTDKELVLRNLADSDFEFSSQVFRRYIGAIQTIMSGSSKASALVHLISIRRLPVDAVPPFLWVCMSIVSSSDAATALCEYMSAAESGSQPSSTDIMIKIAEVIVTIPSGTEKARCIVLLARTNRGEERVLQACLSAMQTLIAASHKESAIMDLLRIENLSSSFIENLAKYTDQWFLRQEDHDRVRRAIDAYL